MTATSQEANDGVRSPSRGTFLKGAAIAAGAVAGGLDAGLSALAAEPLHVAAASVTPLHIEIDAGQNAAPFLWFKQELIQKFGADPKIIGLPFVGQYEKIVSEMVARTATYDLLVFPPQMIGDFVAQKFLEPLDGYTHMLDPKLSDVLPVYRDPNLKRHGTLYALPYDGDLLQVVYRTDLFNNPAEQRAFKARYKRDLRPPRSWSEYMDIARFFHRPPHLYGNAFYGQRGFCYAWFINVFAAYGGRWFDAKTMKATINSNVGSAALNLLLAQKQYAPPNILQVGYPELNEAFLNGSTAMVVQWDDLPLKVNNPQMSKVVGKGGWAPCPVRSYMPYSRVMAVSAYSKNKAAAYQVAAYMSLNQQRFVYDPGCGEDPVRSSVLDARLAKSHTGASTLPPAQARQYVSAIKQGILAGYPELSIPGAPRYLDTLDQFVNQALAGQLSAKQALDSCASEWDSLTQQLDQGAQMAAYGDWIASFRRAGIAY